MPRTLLLLMLGVCAMAMQSASALTGQVKVVDGAPMLLVNGRPTAPLIFIATPWTNRVKVTAEWQKFEGSFVAPEDTDHAGLHIQFGITPKVLWVDGVRFSEGPAGSEAENLARGGDFEGPLGDFARDWTLSVREEFGAKAAGTADETTAAVGRQSLKVDVQSGGADMWHAQISQAPHRLIAGRTYILSAWLKADRPAAAHLWVVEQGGDWSVYGSVGDPSFEREYRRAGDAGIHIHSVTVPLGRYREGQEPDFDATDYWVERILALDPEGVLIPRIGLDAEGWWEGGAEDMMLFDDGTRGLPSVASEKWRQGAAAALRATVRHLEARYGDRIVGYHPCGPGLLNGAGAAEWFYDRAWGEPMSCYEPAMSLGFREWVRTKYGGRIEVVRRGWRERVTSFEDIRAPSREERLRTHLGAFRDPRRERKLIDFFEYAQVAMVEPVETCAHIVREETRGQKLVVLFYGYLYDMAGIPNGPQTSGHLALARLLECPDVDILCGPISYFDRGLGGAGPFMAPVESIRAHGKLWLNEEDTRTYLALPEENFGRVDTPQHTFWVHQRNFAQVFARRMACWWVGADTGWLDADDIWENLRGLSNYYAENLSPPASTPEIAVITDERSWLYLSCSREVASPLLYEMRHTLYRMGAPFGQYLLSDLLAGRVPEAKLYIFLGCFALTDRGRAAVAKIVRREGTTAVWFYGSGFINADASVENMTELTGFTFDQGAEGQQKVEVVDGKSELLRGVPSQFDAGPVPVPVFFPTEAQAGATVLARFESSGAPAVSVRREGWTSVYVGSLRCPPQLLRNIARGAGVHVYLDSNDVLVTDGRFLAVHAGEAGRRTIRLPRRTVIRDALTGRVLTRRSDSIPIALEPGETRLYRIGE